MAQPTVRVGSVIDGVERIGGGRATMPVANPYNGETIGFVDCALETDVDDALEAARRSFHEAMKLMPAHRRADILRKAADLLESRAESFARRVTLEAGKPIRDARAEVLRAVQVVRFASDEAKTLAGEMVPMDAAIGGERRIGIVRPYPIGVVAAITPFNFPLNLVLHKVAPAIAAGNAVVLKPAEKTPLSAVALARLFEEAGLPNGALNVVLGSGSVIGPRLVADARVAKISFTGSVPVGLKIKEQAGMKKLTLELGSNAPNLVFEDADLEAAANGLVRGAFAFSGQACISAQRIYVQSSVYDAFLDRFLERARLLRMGDPMDEGTDIGPMIDEREARRAEDWVAEAKAKGAVVAFGGERRGALMPPTVLTNVAPEMKVVCREVFAPIVVVVPFDTEEEAIRLANDSDFGLQAGVFTASIDRAMRVAEALETGGVWINEISTYRQDNHPYGGVKLSGVGKEGVKYAVREMMETKFIGMKLA